MMDLRRTRIAAAHGLAALCVLLPMLLAVPPAAAQQQEGEELVREYLRARARVLAERHLQKTGGRLPVRAAAWLPSRSDSIRRVLLGTDEAGGAAPEEPPYVVHHSYYTGKFERPWYRRRFGDVRWAYLGAFGRDPLDTLWTRDLRARLEARFGPPTQRPSDLGADSLARRDDFPQFEYWFVLNGDVPFRVMDTNGPFERGLVVATDHRYRDRLRAMRDAFLGPLAQAPERAPFTDYYYDRDDGVWYRIQFDGRDYRIERARPPALRGASLIDRLRLREADGD